MVTTDVVTFYLSAVTGVQHETASSVTNEKILFIQLSAGTVKIVLGVILQYYSYCISAMYNLMTGVAKYKVRSAESKSTGYFVMLSGVLYITYSIYIIRSHRNSSYNIYTGILIAAVIFTEIGMAIYGLVKHRHDLKRRTEKLLNLCTAIISLSLTQHAILSFTLHGEDISLFVGIGGIVFSSITVIIGLFLQISIYRQSSQQ